MRPNAGQSRAAREFPKSDFVQPKVALYANGGWGRLIAPYNIQNGFHSVFWLAA